MTLKTKVMKELADRNSKLEKINADLLEVCKEVIEKHGFNEGNLDLELETIEISVSSLIKMQKAISKAENRKA